MNHDGVVKRVRGQNVSYAEILFGKSHHRLAGGLGNGIDKFHIGRC